MAIHAPDAVIPIRTIQNLATHPNFGGEVLVIGLGCEKTHTITHCVRRAARRYFNITGGIRLFFNDYLHSEGCRAQTKKKNSIGGHASHVLYRI
ncbi:hypothetical protein BsIDN1_17530 [Bacillus safensis]|uniref:D-galactarate/Altronate dehydratase second domain-containing protein n=1 Tax=Bacillus safensis TaxID=561879 RepID=A0A5S9M5P8_BACIA|nr:hypothetical protein BsIDN1_17530 [Bacillus safensis]